MFNILKNRYLRFKTHEDFFFEFFNNPQHKWIAEDRYIKVNFEEFFSLIPDIEIMPKSKGVKLIYRVREGVKAFVKKI